MSELALGQIKGLSVNSNVVTVPSGHTLYAPGHVLNVYHVQMTDVQSFSSTAGSSYTDLNGLSITVTPESVNSKFLIDATAYMCNSSSASGYLTNGIAIVRNSTELRRTYLRQSISNDTASLEAYDVRYLDSPATTSSITYKIMAGQEQTGSPVTVYVNRTNGSATLKANSYITVMEIAA